MHGATVKTINIQLYKKALNL